MAVCNRAPSSEGLKLAVRNEYQLDGSQITQPDDAELFAHLAVRAVNQLGLDASSLEMEAKLDQLIVYPAGGYYRRHRDTVKETGTFATMFLQIPVVGGHQGGELKVSSFFLMIFLMYLRLVISLFSTYDL